MSSELTALQNKAFEAVWAWGKKHAWFRGVCVDHFPDDEALEADFDAEVASVCMETASYDDPDFYTGLTS